MLRVNVASSSQSLPTTPHALHVLLDQLLLSVRSSSNKYHVELPQILSDGGGAGETEENMMWFALNYEKADGDEDRISGDLQVPTFIRRSKTIRQETAGERADRTAKAQDQAKDNAYLGSLHPMKPRKEGRRPIHQTINAKDEERGGHCEGDEGF